MGFSLWLGLALGLEHCSDLLANRKWFASNPWPAVASQFIKLSPVVECDKALTKTCCLSWEQSACWQCHDDSGARWVPRAPEGYRKKVTGPGPLNCKLQSHPENKSTSVTTLKEPLNFCSRVVYIADKQMQNGALLNYNGTRSLTYFHMGKWVMEP